MSIIYINPYQFAAAYDADAQAYIAAVETADGQALEVGVKDAINAFVVGCKSDGIWAAIKACCIMNDARTLAGALVPLVGPAPTNSNFVAGDYDRETGLVGNATDKEIDTEHVASDLSISNHHLSVYVSSVNSSSGSQAYIGESSATSALIYRSGVSLIFRSANNNVLSSGLSATTTGLIALSRSNNANYTEYVNGSINVRSSPAVSIGSNNIFVFSRGGSLYGDARLAFYSIGESLDLALLDARVTALVNAIGAAIP